MEATEHQIAKWKVLIKKHLGKSCARRYVNIVCDIYCVVEGVKPSLLFDYGMIEPETMKTFLTAVISEDLLPAHATHKIGILQAGEDVLIYNKGGLSTKLLSDTVPVIIDVTFCEGNPKILDTPVSEKIFDQITQAIVNLDPEIGDTSQGMTIHKLNDTGSLNFSTLFGFLLGYPSVYWFDPIVEKDNCLGSVPLCVFSLTGKFSHQIHTVYSYSVPENCVPLIKQALDNWELHMKPSLQGCIFLRDIVFSSKTVTLPAVAL